MEREKEDRPYQYDSFINYNRKDKSFAEQLKFALEEFKPPQDLDVPQRRLVIFRDEKDMTGTEYYQAIENHLRNSNKLIVICSPQARGTQYVDDEIRWFASLRGVNHIIPVLVAGIPNNEARPSQETDKAFPEALCSLMEMPLAVSYLGYDPEQDSIDGGRFVDSWYTLLANIYDVKRHEIEQRDVIKRKQDRLLFSRELAAAALNNLEVDPELSVLLAMHAVSVTYADDNTVAVEAEEMLHRTVQNVQKRRMAAGRTLRGHEGAVWDIAYSPDGTQIATVSEDGTWRLWDATTGDPLLSVIGYVGYNSNLGAMIATPIKALAWRAG
jgi:TIR domain/WD domain, G-beta repeat